MSDLNGVMSYKGYIGSIIRMDDGTFYGRVQNSSDFVTYEGDTVEQLLEEFCISVDEYIAFCAEYGLQKSFLSCAITTETDLPTRYGQWISPDGVSECSVCGRAAPYYHDGDVLKYWSPIVYCPCCGSDMQHPEYIDAFHNETKYKR